MKIQNLFQKVLTLGVVSVIGFSAMLVSGTQTAQASADISASSNITSTDITATDINADANATDLTTTDFSATASKGSQIVSYGKKFMGVPYKFGAATTTTRVFDCSSFTKYIFKKYGVTLERTSAQQAKQGVAVSKANLKVGDLVFFSSGSRANGKNVTHVAVYAGNGKILHTYGSPGVTISDLNSGNWKNTYLKARRVL